jgi:hypothetical protein
MAERQWRAVDVERFVRPCPRSVVPWTSWELPMPEKQALTAATRRPIDRLRRPQPRKAPSTGVRRALGRSRLVVYLVRLCVRRGLGVIVLGFG